MILRTDACEFYRLEIESDPPVSPSAWEASFDRGATWMVSTDLDDGCANWLVAGPDYAGSQSAVRLPLGQTFALIRHEAHPETIVREPDSHIYVGNDVSA